MVAKSKDELAQIKRAVRKGEVEKLVKNLVRIPSHKDVPSREREVAFFLREFLTDQVENIILYLKSYTYAFCKAPKFLNELVLAVGQNGGDLR